MIRHFFAAAYPRVKLAAALRPRCLTQHRRSIEEAAQVFCRSSSIDGLKRKAEELGLIPQKPQALNPKASLDGRADFEKLNAQVLRPSVPFC